MHDTQAVVKLIVPVCRSNRLGNGTDGGEAVERCIGYSIIKGVRRGILKSKHRLGIVWPVGGLGGFERFGAIVTKTPYVDDVRRENVSLAKG
jgi:hypothetical protein